MLPFGNSSGVGPQGFGAQPTPFEALWAANNQQSSMQLMQWAALSDPTVNAATRTAVDLVSGTDPWGPWGWFGRNDKADYAGNKDNPDYKFKGNSYEDFLNTPLGEITRTGVATAAMHTDMFGGSLGQMAFGIQQMMGSAGLRLDGGRFAGAGFVTDMTSQFMIDSIRENFFDPTSGLSNYKAQGLDKDDFGELGFLMARKGMMAGMDAGNMTRITSKEEYGKYIEELNDSGFTQVAKDAQRHMNSFKDGESIDIQAFKPNVNVFKKINEMFEGAADTISQFRDVFGPGASVSQVIAEAEKLTGMSYGDTGADRAAKEKLNSFKVLAQTSGMDLRSMLLADQTMTLASSTQMAQMYGGLPSDYARMAATSTPIIWEQSTIAMQNRAETAKLFADKGIGYVNTVTQDETSSLIMRGLNSIIGESPTAIEALYAADTMSNIDEDTRQQIYAKVEELGKQGTDDGIARVNADLKKILTDNRIEPGMLMRQAGGDPSELINAMTKSSEKRLFDMASNNDAARTLDRTLPGILNATSSGTRLGLGDDANSLNLIKAMVGSLDSESVVALTSALKSGDDAAVNKLIDSKDQFIKQYGLTYKDASGKEQTGAEAFKLLLSDVYGETKTQMGGGDNFEIGTSLNDVYQKFLTSPQAIQFVSEEQRSEYKAQAVNRTLLNKSLGNERLTQEGIFTQIARGFFGEGQVTDSAAISYMLGDEELKGNIQTYNITNESAGNLTETQLQTLSEQLGGTVLDDALGIKRDANKKITNYDEVQKRLSSSEGVYDLINAIGMSGAAWDNTQKDGTNSQLTVADKDSTNVVRSKMDQLNRANSALALSGLTPDQRKAETDRMNTMADEEIAKEITALQTKAVKQFMSGSASDMDAVVKRIVEGDDASVKGIKESGAQEQITAKMRERIDELTPDAREGDKEAKKKIAEYRDTLNMIDGSGSDAVLRVEMIYEDRAWGTLHTKGG